VISIIINLGLAAHTRVISLGEEETNFAISRTPASCGNHDSTGIKVEQVVAFLSILNLPDIV
jgi:hypothetical protein